MSAPVQVVMGGETSQLALPGYHVQHRMRDMWGQFWTPDLTLDPNSGAASLVPKWRVETAAYSRWSSDTGTAFQVFQVGFTFGAYEMLYIDVFDSNMWAPSGAGSRFRMRPWESHYFIFSLLAPLSVQYPQGTLTQLPGDGLTLYFGGRYALFMTWGSPATLYRTPLQTQATGHTITYLNIGTWLPIADIPLHQSKVAPAGGILGGNFIVLFISPVPGGFLIGSRQAETFIQELDLHPITKAALIDAGVVIKPVGVNVAWTDSVAYFPSPQTLLSPIFPLGAIYQAAPTVSLIQPAVQPEGTSVSILALKGDETPFSSGDISDFKYAITFTPSADGLRTPYLYGARFNFEPTHQIIPAGI